MQRMLASFSCVIWLILGVLFHGAFSESATEQSLGLKTTYAPCVKTVALNNEAILYFQSGETSKAVGCLEDAISFAESCGICALLTIRSNLGEAYMKVGDYGKALQNLTWAMSTASQLNCIEFKDSGWIATITGQIHSSSGNFTEALKCYQEALPLTKKPGGLLCLMGQAYMGKGDHTQALKYIKLSLDEYEDPVVTDHNWPNDPSYSVDWAKQVLINLYVDLGKIELAKSLATSGVSLAAKGRLSLVEGNYEAADRTYSELVENAEQTLSVNDLFTAYTGLGKVHEALEHYKKSGEYYEKGMKLTEEIRSGLLPSERKNFFEVKINGFVRSEPAKGLTRVRMKLNQASESIESSEVTRARAFSDILSSRSEGAVSGISRDTLEKENGVVSKLALLKKELAKTDREKQAARYENLKSLVQSAESDLNAFIENLWSNHKAYAAVKYPKPVTLKESSLKPDEWLVLFDVSDEGVGVKLIKGKEIAQTFYTKWKSEDLERDIKKFRQPFEQLKLREFDSTLGNYLYKKLLLSVLAHVPDGVHLIIIPDGILATLPFEALVVRGKPTWQKIDRDWPDAFKDYPEGLTFLGDEHPISYYQSITALTLARATDTKNIMNQKLLVMADPVFELSDKRVQTAGQSKLSEQDKKNNLALMQTIQDSSQGMFRLKRLNQTTDLADNLEKLYGPNCLSLTGLKANKSDFLTKIAPNLEQYSGVVFATHGVMSTHVPGLMEPFLALTMVPPGIDGFLKMSDVLSLKMNADIVALTACQSGLGKELSGEGVMSMGRAFQYAGARSVLMSLWSVEEISSVILTEGFFRHRKSGKSKLDSLKLAREEIRKQGFEHPFFWAPFILVGEVQ